MCRYFAVYALAGSLNYFFVKLGLRYSSPLPFMSVRYALAGLTLILASLLMGRRPRPIVSADMLLLALFSTVATALWSYGLLYIDPASSAIFSYTMPFFALMLSIVLIGERPG